VDFAEYRRKNDMRAVKKNCTIPSWLNYEAERAGVNFSAVLQTALKQELNVNRTQAR
jgi:post-segregation antitoxin (ccd killing protein)